MAPRRLSAAAFTVALALGVAGALAKGPRVDAVCRGIKHAYKSEDKCNDWQDDLCASVQSEECDLCGFLQDDEGCDLQSGVEVEATVEAAVDAATTDILAAVFGGFRVGTARFIPDAAVGGECVVDLATSTLPAGVTADCTVVATLPTVTVTCPAGTVPAAPGCNSDAPELAVVGSVSTFALSANTATCVYPVGTLTGIVNIVCTPIAPAAPAAAASRMAAELRANVAKIQARGSGVGARPAAAAAGGAKAAAAAAAAPAKKP